jgi:hypothetical protein
MVRNGPGIIPDDIRNALILLACGLNQKKLDEMRFHTTLLWGAIATEWKVHMVGTRAGVLFKSQFDYEGGIDCQVNFLLNRADLEEGAEMIRQLEEEGGYWRRGMFEGIDLSFLSQFEDMFSGVSSRRLQ